MAEEIISIKLSQSKQIFWQLKLIWKVKKMTTSFGEHCIHAILVLKECTAVLIIQITGHKEDNILTIIRL